ncbi:MAG TPA: PEP-CTERM-box response regulator transcription factor [Candidatus Acidoferrales bacterium]|nr:PEP-CTERM-box response regulator transcription factor [Candidatus Acidoferrales bacterium]
MKPKILFVDDEENILKQMRWAFAEDYTVLTAATESDALAVFRRERPPVVSLDLSLNAEFPSDLAGLRLLQQMIEEEPATRVIVVSGHNEEATVLKAVRLGAFDYYSKPIALEEFKVMVKRALHIYALNHRLQSSHAEPETSFHGLTGVSKSMQEIYRFIERVALSDISVLICGESGTGKELVAHAIHQRSARKENPFIVVNCGAIPDALLESELFGHEKGAFTGAHAQKKGKFELAHTGTLFLDEIGELAPPLQVKLLRFLQDRIIERIGGNQKISVDVRIIAATNRDLEKEMENNLFREDLYYRLKVVPITIPPLRERKEDILPLAYHFLKKYGQEHRKPLLRLSPEAERRLLSYSWPGNVRELENLINRAVVMSAASVLTLNDLGLDAEIRQSDVNLKEAKKAIEIEYVRRALLRSRGVVSRAAKELGISRVNLYELMAKYGIAIDEFKTAGAAALEKDQTTLE